MENRAKKDDLGVSIDITYTGYIPGDVVYYKLLS